MRLLRLVLREIAHRKLNFVLGWLSVAVAVGCLVGALTLLDADRQRTVQAGKRYEDEMRKITKIMGFNVLVLPEDQDLTELHVSGTVTSTMPESYVSKLANSQIVTVNHLLPTITKRVTWAEHDLTILLTGTRGEVPLLHRKLKKPLQEQVPSGSMVVGYGVHQRLELSQDDTVTLMGRDFKVTQLYKERGTVDDGTVWINLKDAQEMLGMENLIHAILALECNCAAQDRVAQIREEIAGILPGTQVIERGDIALARAEARNTAKQEAEMSLHKHEQFASVLVPLVIVGCAVWIAVLTLGNVRQRTVEIGILRAIGFRSTQILSIFLGKALLIGLLGGAAGFLGGVAVGVIWGDLPAGPGWGLVSSSNAGLLLLSLVMAPLLSGVACWIPAMLAAQQDPAVVLQQE